MIQIRALLTLKTDNYSKNVVEQQSSKLYAMNFLFVKHKKSSYKQLPHAQAKK